MSKIINGIQQIGIGVSNAKAVFNWYRKNLGFDILVFEDVATANLMTQYTNDVVEKRYALLALNLKGGGGLEIWQFKDRIPEANKNVFFLGDLGINIMKIRAKNTTAVYDKLSKIPLPFLSENSKNTEHFIFTDPWNNIVQVVENDYEYVNCNAENGGVLGAVIGVSDMEKSLFFYKKILGYDILFSDNSGLQFDFKGMPGGENLFRRVVLKHSNRKVGGFGKLLGPTEIELIQVLDREPNKIYKNRLWGDLGYIHLCFDINGMKTFRNESKRLNFPFTVDSSDSFDMGDAAGHFSYIEDPDGTLIEFVETHKVPILKKLGIYIDLKKRDPFKPLSKWLIKAMKVHRVKRDI